MFDERDRSSFINGQKPKAIIFEWIFHSPIVNCIPHFFSPICSAFWFGKSSAFRLCDATSFYRSFFIIIHQFFDWSKFGLWDSWTMTSFAQFSPFLLFNWKCYCCCCCPSLYIYIRSSSLLHLYSRLVKRKLHLRPQQQQKLVQQENKKIRKTIQHWTIFKCISAWQATHRVGEASYTVIFEHWKFRLQCLVFSR